MKPAPLEAMDAALPLLRASRLFGALDAQHHAEFARTARRSRYERGAFLWQSGDPVREFTIIVSGVIKVCAPMRQGPSSIIGIFGPRESIGDSAVIRGRDYPADAIAATETTEVLWIDKAIVLEAMARDATVANAVNRSLAEHALALQHKIRILGAGNIEARLATLFLHLAERFGDDLDDGDVMIPLVVSRTDLACLVGTTPETTIRVLSRWQKSGILTTTDDGFRIGAIDPLERLAATED